jgi:hypothetical protein
MEESWRTGPGRGVEKGRTAARIETSVRRQSKPDGLKIALKSYTSIFVTNFFNDTILEIMINLGVEVSIDVPWQRKDQTIYELHRIRAYYSTVLNP